ncbi:MAG: fibronectin type III-like domain-contianing protein [Bifidobacteriaceae bacterium]|jgi:beta-glucosidase|nr:fibronectin type III-like domain-contianing protein [Bifidobacteriaceae bacterium]
MWGGIDYSSLEVALTEASVQPTRATRTAVYVLARNSGEGADRSSGAGDYLLSATERANLELIGRTYENVVVVLNVGGIVDTSFYSSINASTPGLGGGLALDSLFLMSQAGQESGHALVEVLSGATTPSGKLTDSWASAYWLYPASATFARADGDSLQENYTEGIYVGYRYFDSFHKALKPNNPDGAVNYPFGYGGSYTDFSIRTDSVTATAETVRVEATVTNTGTTYSGKEVVQVYVSAPQTGLDKPYQELAGFGKTANLAPGESQTLTITFPTAEMASYDEARAANVLEGGDYVIRVGNSSRSTAVGGIVEVPTTTIVEQLSNQETDESTANELTSDPANFYGYRAEAAQIAAAPRARVDFAGFTAPNNASPYAQTVTVPPSSEYHAIDGAVISTIEALVDPAQTDWEGSGLPYQPKQGETIKAVTPVPGATLYDVYRGNITLEQFVAGLTVTQLATMVEGGAGASPKQTLAAAGAAGYTTYAYQSLGVAGMVLADGPAGVRITQQVGGNATTPPTGYQYCTAWPIGTMLAQTWNQDLLERVGAAIGEEMVEYGVTLWLAPGMNIHRDPLGGRNFEYYSEDPLISGIIATATTKGVQSNPGVGVTVKHYAGNSQETDRNTSNDTINERALRELYLKGFEIVVKSTQPMAVMSSYNKINGTYVAGDFDMLTDILRGEWDFKGLVMTDWGGSRAGIVNCMYAGNDLIEPGDGAAAVINKTVKNPPTIDLFGLPAFTTSSWFGGQETYTWLAGNLSLNAGGGETITTTVDSSIIGVTPTSGSSVFDRTTWSQITTPLPPFTSVDEAYRKVTDLLNLAPNAGGLSDAQKGGITVTPTSQAPGGEVLEYTVTLKGDYTMPMRLGDLQRSAQKILTIVMQSADFAALATAQGVPGITVAPYSAQFTDLATYTASAAGAIVPKTATPAPAPSASTPPAVTGPPNQPAKPAAPATPTTPKGPAMDGVVSTVAVGGRVGSPVHASSNGWPTGTVLTYQWLRDGSPVAGATGESYTPTKDDRGKTLSVVVTGRLNGTSSTQTITIGTIAAGKIASARPKITGKRAMCKVLKVKRGSWTAGISVSYQWYRGAKAIKGATSATYKVKAADVGKSLRVKVTAKKAGFTSVARVSPRISIPA